MVKDKNNEEERLDNQYEFGLNEDVRKEIAEEEDSHAAPEDKADEDDDIIKDN
ncbi:MAG: hypothetical protein L0I79_01480 [Atopostipes sp.]|nr:hypothetical protein [Atopostipes sp.]